MLQDLGRGDKHAISGQDNFLEKSEGSSVKGNVYQKNKVPTDGLTSAKENDTSMMRHIKTIRQTEIEKQLTAGLSEQQLQDERE